jgi:hypothetical protein
MIPKTIHYCWFGGNPLPELARKCLASWEKHLPDYQIVRWDESNFDVSRYPFAKEALAHRKFAFVSDVCRLHALVEMGGIYMDTDVEALKTLDPFLRHAAFSGFENDDYVPTGLMAAEKGSAWARELLAYYDNRPFIDENGQPDTLPNTMVITAMMKEKGFVMNNTFQEIEGYVAFYPNRYFCPKSYKTGKITITPDTYCIHHFAKSWVPAHKRLRNILKMKAMDIVGYNTVNFFIRLVKPSRR